MSIAASGAVSFADLRTEFVGGSSAISMDDLYRGGSNILSKAGDNPAVNLAASVPTSGVIDIQDFYSTAKGFKNTVSSSTTNVDADALFGDDYDVNYPKIIDINSGVTIGGNGDEAIDIPSGLASTLTINNAGTVIGFGGASAGAAGGSAINCATSGVTINNTGQISGGGGAGNVGGQGGNGSYSTSTTLGYSSSTAYWKIAKNGYTDFRWIYITAGSSSYAAYGYVGSHLSGVTSYAGYGRGPFVTTHTNLDGDQYAKSYRVITTTTSSSTGGAGGSFGVGAGYNQSATNGGSGASGSNNAGSGGAGSNGAALGTAASTSSAGANGNASNGAAGNAGGAAGAAVTGTSVTMNNTGTLNGAVA